MSAGWTSHARSWPRREVNDVRTISKRIRIAEVVGNSRTPRQDTPTFEAMREVPGMAEAGERRIG
jgi:hypothetical protein